MRDLPLEISALVSRHADALAEFFETVRKDGSEAFFHPHAMSREAAFERAAYVGSDSYFVMTRGSTIVGYGMLRGWDEGYDTPSLGLVIHPDYRGKGLGGLLMNFLHVAAALRGAKEVLLHVDQGNEVAIKLYQSLGYRLAGATNRDDFVGRLTLARQ